MWLWKEYYHYHHGMQRLSAYHFPVSFDKVLECNAGTNTKVHVNICLVNEMQKQQQVVLTSFHRLQELLG